MGTFTIAACQMDSQDDKDANITQALDFIDEAAHKGADVISLPEMFSFMGEKEAYSKHAEPVPGKTTEVLADKAATHGLYVHSGSFFEEVDDTDRVYNTSVVIDPNGEIQAQYRKAHLFDVTIGDEVVTQESKYVAPGDDVTVVETDLATFGLSVCYDLRFSELYRTMAMHGAEVLFVPAAFTLFTGKDHWLPLLKARAIETQCYVVAAGQIGDKPSSVPSFGKSVIIDPWGNVIRMASDREEVVTAEVDLDYLADVRQNIPCLEHKRDEIY
jgi:deaminated glutathione amidase